jgi:hypothetical protein
MVVDVEVHVDDKEKRREFVTTQWMLEGARLLSRRWE